MNSFNNANSWADGTYNLAAGGANGINPEQRHQLVVSGNSGDTLILTDNASLAQLLVVNSVFNVNNAPSGNVTITGTATQGQTLTAANTLADADGLSAISYQWRADGVAIGGATSNTYRVSASDAGKALSVTANYTDGKGTAESVTSSPVKVNSAHKAFDDTATTSEKTSLSIAVLGNDSDPDEAEGDSKTLAARQESSSPQKR